MSTETEVSNEANVLPITILPELEELLPALMPDEKEELRRSIETEGIRDNLLIWRTVREGGEECRILIDGHNRYRITEAMGRPLASLPVADIDFAGIEEAKQWIIVNQLMRRNLRMRKGRISGAWRMKPQRADVAATENQSVKMAL